MESYDSYCLSEIVLASLLHDIGKFAQRAKYKFEFSEIEKELFLPLKKEKFAYEHALYTLKFLEKFKDYLPTPSNKFENPDENYINFAAKHHKPENPYEWIIAEADRISAGMEREEAEVGEKRLLSVFSEVFLEKSKNDYVYYDLFPLEPNGNVFPEKFFEKDVDYKALWDSFLSEFKSLPYNCNFYVYLPALVSILEKYTWCIPSATYHTLPDISLFDHSLSTSAIASALYLYHKNKNTLNEENIKNKIEKKFLLLALDLSGIQKFIFNITVDAARGAAKVLRARSFYLNLLLEAACLKILEVFGLFIVNHIMDAGGRSILILPNLEDAKKKISKIKKETEKFLKERFFAELAINFAFLEVSAQDLGADRFVQTFRQLNYEIELAKNRKFSSFLKKPEDFIYIDFTTKYTQEKGICKLCGRHYGEQKVEDEYYCRYCCEFKNLGEWLIRSDFIGFDKKKRDEKFLKIFDWYVYFLKDVKNREEFYLCYSLRPSKKEVPVRYIASYVPRFNEEDNYNEIYLNPKFNPKKELLDEAKNGIKNRSIKTFHHIALCSLWKPNGKDEYKGKAYLGVLKADVDRLGFIFSYGLNHPYRPFSNKLTLARFCFLSRMLNFFFTGYLTKVLEENFRNTYTVFAGGDDLFFIGPWEEMIKLANKIYSDFRKFTGNNSDITLSASLTLIKPRQPVNSVAYVAEENLNKAKKAGRDRFFIFGEIVKWEDFKEIEEDFKTINSIITQSNGKIGTSFVYKLLHLAEMKEKFEKGEDIFQTGKWHAMFRYLIGKHFKDLTENHREGLIKMFVPGSTHMLKIPIIWAILKNRR